MATLRKHDLVRQITANLDVSKDKANQVLDFAFMMIEKEVSKGNRVSLLHFGRFFAGLRTARMGRNPQTGESLQLPEMRTIRFEASKKFKRNVR